MLLVTCWLQVSSAEGLTCTVAPLLFSIITWCRSRDIYTAVPLSYASTRTWAAVLMCVGSSWASSCCSTTHLASVSADVTLIHHPNGFNSDGTSSDLIHVKFFYDSESKLVTVQSQRNPQLVASAAPEQINMQGAEIVIPLRGRMEEKQTGPNWCWSVTYAGLQDSSMSR